MNRFSIHEQITRLVCVEGWSAIAWWPGLRFDDLIRAYPPMSQAKWARLESSVNLDSSGNPDPYFASLDVATACHPQTLLATHFNGSAPHCGSWSTSSSAGARKTWLEECEGHYQYHVSREAPTDYWAKRGYSRYDGI
jgi:hypothetical protein